MTVADVSFSHVLGQAIGASSSGRFDGKATISQTEAEALVTAIAQTSPAQREQAILRAQALMNTPRSFADERSLQTFRAGVFGQGKALQRTNWAPHAGKVRTAFAALPGKISVMTPAANGGRPVVVFIPRDLDPTKPVRVVTSFHGKGGDLSSEYGPLIRRVAQVAPGSQSIFVFPQGWMSVPHDAWMDPAAGESFAGLQTAAQAEASTMLGQSLTFSGRTVVGHSNGGFAVANAARAGELQADRLLLLDCFYETDAVRTWEVIGDWVAANRPASVKVVHSTNQVTRIDDFAKRTRGQPVRIESSTLGHSGIPPKHFSP